MTKYNFILNIIYLEIYSLLIKKNIFVQVLTQNLLNKEGSSVLSRLYGIFNEKSDLEMTDANNITNYTISDLIILLVYVYTLIGEECYYGVEEEDRIKVYIYIYLLFF